MSTNDGPKFNLNLSEITKNQNQQNESNNSTQNQTNQNQTQSTTSPTRTRTRQRPTRTRNPAVARKNLVIESSDSSSDIELDADIAQIPIGKDDTTPAKAEEAEEAPVVQINALPELEDDDDDEDDGKGKEKNKLSLLFDLLLTQDQCEEPDEEWNYKEFIKQYARTEAQEDGNDIEEEDEIDYGEEEEIEA